MVISCGDDGDCSGEDGGDDEVRGTHSSMGREGELLNTFQAQSEDLNRMYSVGAARMKSGICLAFQ